MITPKKLEDKLISIMDDEDIISVDDLALSELTLYELIHLITFKNDFEKIEIINLDLEDFRFFSDEKYSHVLCPYFDLQKKVA